MASLTTTLDSPDRGKPIIQPAPAAPSLVGGLAGLASGVIQGMDHSYDQTKSINQDKAANDLQSGMRGIFQNAQEMNQGAGQSEMIDQINTGAEDYNKVKRAFDQGRVPAEAVDAKMESLVSSLAQKYPDQQDFIAGRMKQLGLDHYVWRDIRLSKAQQEASDQEVIAGRAKYLNAAYGKGLVLPTMSEDDAVDAGRKALYIDTLRAQQKEQVTISEQLANIDEKKYNMAKSEAKRIGTQTAMAEVGMHAGLYNDMLTNIFDQVKTDDQYDQLVGMSDKIIGGAQTWYNHYKQVAISTGSLDSGDVKTLDDYFNSQVEGMKSHYFGDTSRFAQVDRAYKMMQNRLGLNAEQSAPVWSMIHKMFGDGALQLFNGDPKMGLSDDMIKRLQSELVHYDPTRAESAFGTMAQIREILKGNNALANIKESDITVDHIKAFNAAANVNGQAVLSKKATDQNHNEFLNGLGALGVYAANGIQPGYKNLSGLDWITGGITNIANINALVAEQSNPAFKEQAADTLKITRGASVKLIEVAKTYSPNVVWDGKHSRFVPKADAGSPSGPKDELARANVIGGEFGWNDYGRSTALDKTTISPDAKKQADILNANIGFLVRTASFDENVPKGVTGAQLAEHYGLGTPLPQKKEAGVKVDSFSKQVNDLEGFAVKDTVSAQQNLPYKSPVKFSSDEDAAVRTMIGEAGSQGEKGLAAVAAVIRNRSAQSGKSITDVVRASGQFEPWMHTETSNRLMSIDPNSPEYQKALEIFRKGEDPTGGATHFLNPDLQSKLGRDIPEWAKSSKGTRIGSHVFYNIGYKG